MSRHGRHVRGKLRAVVVGMAVLASAGVWAQPEDPGEFDVITATHELTDGVYRVDAQIYLRLSTDAASILRGSVPLTIRIEVQFLNRLRFWFDTLAHETILRYRLNYNPFTDRYTVFNVSTDYGVQPDQQIPFDTLAAALAFIGEVDQLPVLDAALLDEDLRYELRIRAVLDKGELPGPLAWWAVLRRDWSIGSEWFTWRLDDD